MKAGNQRSFYRRYGKRWIDLLVASVAIIYLWPVIILICILVSLESPGGPFFVQKRVGHKMVPFRLIKFRTMRLPESRSQQQFEPGGSARITQLGKLLRKSKLDELPELFNVLKGEMSLIGPRPEVEIYVTEFNHEFRRLVTVRPGLSDFASIKYRDEELLLQAQADPENHYKKSILMDKLSLGQKYVNSISLELDVAIIARTIRKVFFK